MKNIIKFNIFYFILFLTTAGCSDFINWMGEDLKDFETQGEFQERKEPKDEIIILDYKNERPGIAPYKDSPPEEKNGGDLLDTYHENIRKNRYEDEEIEKRDKEGNKTYWENE